MKIKRKTGVKKQIGWGVIGQLAYVVGQFVILSVLARFASPEDVGRLAFAGAITLPVLAFFNLGLRFNQATNIEQMGTFFEFFLLRTLTTTLGYLIILCVSIFLITDDSTRLILIIFGAAKAVETFSDLFYGVFQSKLKMVLVAKSQIARSILSSVLFSGLLIGTESVEIAFVGHFVSWLIVAILFDYRNAKKISVGTEGPVSYKSLHTIAKQSLPLGYAGFLSMLNTSVPRFVIESVMGLAALGYFTVVAYALQAGTTVVLAISHSITSTLAGYSTEGNKKAFRELLVRIIGLFTTFGLLMLPMGYYFGDFLIVFIFGNDYEGLNLILTFIIIVFIVSTCSTVLQTGVIAKRDFILHAKNRLLLLVLTLLFTIPGVYYGGLEGVSLAMAFAHAGQTIFLYWSLFGIHSQYKIFKNGRESV
ncbi:MAG: oligosaccharide flippase family protein [Candidatus Thiodiazotropha sp. LLP2]